MQVDPFEDFKAFSVALQEYWNYSDYAIAGALQREPGGEFKDNSVRKIHEGWCLAKRKAGPVVPDKVWADIAAACDRIGQTGEGAVELAQALDRLSNAVDPEDVAQVRYKLDQHKLALQEWLDKTEWVQKTASGHELGMHRADVLKQRIETLSRDLEAALQANSKPDYSWLTVEDYEKCAGLPVNDAFRIGWNMARTTDTMLGIKSDTPAPSQPVTLTDTWLLEQFKHHPNWELSTSNDPECDPSVFWLVHEVKGGRNDREWVLIGEGESPRAAIIAALREKEQTK